jgi:hypothetical protein
MRNGTFLVGENQNLPDAVALCAARAFFTTEIKRRCPARLLGGTHPKRPTIQQDNT